jgi:hypothetical protein
MQFNRHTDAPLLTFHISVPRINADIKTLGLGSRLPSNAMASKTCPLYVYLDTMSLAKGATAETTASISACATLNDFNVSTRCMATQIKLVLPESSFWHVPLSCPSPYRALIRPELCEKLDLPHP